MNVITNACTYLLVDLLEEFQLLFQGLAAVLGIDVSQGLVVKVLKEEELSSERR